MVAMLVPGTRVGAYDIVSLLGAGGMGEVYRAHDAKLKRDVAIKVLQPAVANDPARLARFSREAQVLASLNHPNIAHIHGLEDSNGVRALVMELVEGLTLADRIAQGPMPLDETLAIAQQIADALDAAHERGIVHRDLKPANVAITPEGRVKVLDFGLAKLGEAGTGVNRSDAATVTMATEGGTMLGTIPYMSPEQARGHAVDKRADIWAFGCVLYEMLSGRSPFARPTATDTLAAIVERDPDWQFLDAAPVALRRVVRRCLEKDPRRRMRDIGDARVDVDDAIVAPAAAPPAGRRWRLAAAAAIVALAAAAFVAWPLPAADAPRLHLDILTPPTNDPVSFALSPDGRSIAFVARNDGEDVLWVRALEQPDARPMAGTEGASYPFWSPDGTAVAFFADGKVKRLNLPDERPLVIADAGPVGRGGTWSRSGTILYATANSGIHRVSERGGSATPVTTPRDGGSHRFPSFLPDGDRFLFFVAFGRPALTGLYLGSIDGTAPRRLFGSESPAVYVPPGYLLTTRQGALVAFPFDADRAEVTGDPIRIAQTVGVDFNSMAGAFSASSTGLLAMRSSAITRRQLVWVEPDGRVSRTLGAPDDAGMIHPELSPDGRTIAVQRTEQGDYDIWLVDAATGASSRFTFDAGVDSAPVWSRDGGRIVFRSTRNGVFDLFVKDAAGDREEQPLFASSENKYPLDVAPDGRVLYLVENPAAAADLWVVGADGRAPRPLVTTAANEDQGQFSPDGRRVAYRSNERGRAEIYVRDVDGSGALRQVSHGGGQSPRWRRDGAELFYIAPDNRLMAVPIDQTRPQSPTFGVPRPMFPTRLPAIASRAQYAVHPDGRQFLMNTVAEDAETSSIAILQRWLPAPGAR